MASILDTIRPLAVRFAEPSSWAGLAGIAGVVGLNVNPGLLQAAIYVGAGVAGLLAFLMPEQSAPHPKA